MERLTLTYGEYLDYIKESFESISLNEIFGIKKPFSDAAYQIWVENNSMEDYYTYLAYILTLKPTQEHVSVEGYLWVTTREIFINLINTLFEEGYYDWDDKWENVEYLTRLVDHTNNMIEYRNLNFKSIAELIDMERRFDEKVNDDK